MLRELVVATSNESKRAELQSVGNEFGIRLRTQDEIQQALGLPAFQPAEEKYPTYAENAFAKAKSCWEWCGLPSLADDSGLEVFALGGAPGVFSARYAGESADDRQRIEKVLEELRNVSASGGEVDRRAQFCCALALVVSADEVLRAESAQPGHILSAPRGAGGFGYDPIFCIDALGKTYAEIDFSTTCQFGFRGQAARALFSQLSAEGL